MIVFKSSVSVYFNHHHHYQHYHHHHQIQQDVRRSSIFCDPSVQSNKVIIISIISLNIIIINIDNRINITTITLIITIAIISVLSLSLAFTGSNRNIKRSCNFFTLFLTKITTNSEALNFVKIYQTSA